MTGQYETVIGLEVHVELATKTKIFCGCSTAFGKEPNMQICPVCAGMPGALPVLNRQVVEYAMAVGIAANCKVNQYCTFDRKNYFYPDNPQNYQISQLYFPICRDGWLEIHTKTGNKKIRIHEIHLEEDAGKLIHEEAENCSMVDYNRSGVPLIEIVTEPDMENAEEVLAFLDQLRLLIQYVKASDCKLQEGSMRVDVNLSIRKKGTETLGTRTEMKNLSSFRAISKAVEEEKKRQTQLLDQGCQVVQETRRWDDSKETSFSMRSKEDSQDYRYFPDPDLPPVRISDEWLERVKKSIPELQPEKQRRYENEYKLPAYDAEIITGSPELARIFEETTSLGSNPKKVSNWLLGETLRLLKEQRQEPKDLKFSPQNLASLIRLTEEGTVNYTSAKEVFEKIFESDVEPAGYVKANGLEIACDRPFLEKIIRKVLAENPKVVGEYRSGKEKVLGYLVGQVMKETKGKAAPPLVNEMLKALVADAGTLKSGTKADGGGGNFCPF